MNTNVNFKVLEIHEANKQGYVVITVKFNTNKVYEYVRKAYGNIAVIDGCRVYFSDTYEVEKIEREYQTKGKKRITDTSTMTKSTSNKIKDELKTKQISVPQVTPMVKPNKEVHHEKYQEIKTCLECGIPVYLSGPAGSGKNFTVEQIAKDLGWEFYFSNSIQQEYKLTGFVDAGGKFHETEFYKACTSEKDCIFFLDEIDASIPEVLVLLNAAIANGYFEFPNGRVDFDNVHFVSAGNTVGAGADDMYTGRMVLDQATLDRFAIIEFDYSLNIEASITNNNTGLIAFVRQLRTVSKSRGIRATFSYRCLTMVTKLEQSGMDLNTAIKISVLKGLDKDTVNTLNLIGDTKYHKALKEIQTAA